MNKNGKTKLKGETQTKQSAPHCIKTRPTQRKKTTNKKTAQNRHRTRMEKNDGKMLGG